MRRIQLARQGWTRKGQAVTTRSEMVYVSILRQPASLEAFASHCGGTVFLLYSHFRRESLRERVIMFLLPSHHPSSPCGHVGPEAPLQGEALHGRQGGGRRPGTLLFRAGLARSPAQVMGPGPTQVVGARQRLWEE